MKKILLSLLVLSLVFSIGLMTGCGSSSSDEVKYADQDFIKSMSKGLEARWALTQKATDDESTIEEMQSYIQAELDQISQYESATFEDTKLQEKALRYINVLKDSYENANYSLSDKDYDKWQAYIDERAVLIKDFVDNYGLTVSSKYQATLDEFLANGQAVESQNAQKEAINNLVSGLDFEVTKEEYGWKTYSATLENTTDYDITDLSLEINLLDGEGVIVETAYADANNVKKGQKAKLEFETDAKFEKLEPTVSWFEVAE